MKGYGFLGGLAIVRGFGRVGLVLAFLGMGWSSVADSSIPYESGKSLGYNFNKCFGGGGISEDSIEALKPEYGRARNAVQNCQGNEEAANVCCSSNPVSCLQRSKFAGLLTMAMNAVPVASSMALSKRCRKVKALLGTATSLTSATAQLCQQKIGSCMSTCEQKVYGAGGRGQIAALIEKIKQVERKKCASSAPPVCTLDAELLQCVGACGSVKQAQVTVGCLKQIQERGHDKMQACYNLSGKVLPSMQTAMMIQILGSQQAARCEMATADMPDVKAPENPLKGGCEENPNLPLCRKNRPLQLKTTNPDGLAGLEGDGMYDIDNGPDIPDDAGDYLGNGDAGAASLGGVQGGSGGGGGGFSGGGGGGGSGGEGSGARRPAAGPPGSGSQASILKGFNKGGGFSGAGGGSGGYSQRAGGGSGFGTGDGKSRFNLGKYLKKGKGSALKKVSRGLASATSNIWHNIAQRYDNVCHEQKMYCD